MKKIILSALTMLLFSACQKDKEYTPGPTDTVAAPAPVVEPFTKYSIGAGQHYADNNINVRTSYTELRFIAKFDSSAIYTTSDPHNQYDINKLYGFADNNSFHHQFSARFGWRWSNNALRLFGYIYNDGVRNSKELGTVIIGAENTCAIKVTPDKYIFTLNGITDSMPRTSSAFRAEGYKLYPYFGGDEPAPHKITIFIKELK